MIPKQSSSIMWLSLTTTSNTVACILSFENAKTAFHSGFDVSENLSDSYFNKRIKFSCDVHTWKVLCFHDMYEKELHPLDLVVSAGLPGTYNSTSDDLFASKNRYSTCCDEEPSFGGLDRFEEQIEWLSVMNKSKRLQSADHICKALQKKRWPKRLQSAAKRLKEEGGVEQDGGIEQEGGVENRRGGPEQALNRKRNAQEKGTCKFYTQGPLPFNSFDSVGNRELFASFIANQGGTRSELWFYVFLRESFEMV
ncbi:hypothetical protein LXL04_010695 [Taraxacum kok-saghyz]